MRHGLGQTQYSYQLGGDQMSIKKSTAGKAGWQAACGR